MTKTRNTLKIAAVLAMVLTASLLSENTKARFVIPDRTASKVTTIQRKSPDTLGYDPALLKTFISVIRSLDFNKPLCTYSGVINMDDPNDTTNSIHHLKFRFCRVNTGYYYQLGAVEIIHEGKINIYVQHDQRKVVISGQQMVIKPPLNDLPLIIKTLHSESYKFHSSVLGAKRTIAIINEQHLTCKELSVTMDTRTGKLERIYSRLNDFGSPMDKGIDRTIDVRIQQISNTANRNLYPVTENYVRIKDGKWVLTGKYATYELIML